MKQLLKREAEAQRQAKDADVKAESTAGKAAVGAGASCCFADALAEQVGDGLVKWASSNRGTFNFVFDVAPFGRAARFVFLLLAVACVLRVLRFQREREMRCRCVCRGCPRGGAERQEASEEHPAGEDSKGQLSQNCARREPHGPEGMCRPGE